MSAHSDDPKYAGKYRIATTRLRTWDYASDAWYFVTICTQHRQPYFGDVVDGAMCFSAIGEVAAAEWLKSATLRTNIYLDAWVIMPNHVHGIVVINNCLATAEIPLSGSSELALPASQFVQPSVNVWPDVEKRNRFGPLKSGSLQSMINGYKGAVTRWCNAQQLPFAWQSRYYEHMIRSAEALEKIRNYIINNPAQWTLDRENTVGMWM